MTCEWCGHEHARDALCTSRPKWSRRGFLALFGAGVAGLAVSPSLPVSQEYIGVVTMNQHGHVMRFDAILKAYYEPIIAEQLNDRPLLWGDRETKGKTFCVHVD